MTVSSPAPVATHAAATSTLAITDAERWAAWHERGAAHDRAVRRKLAVVAPLVAIVAAVVAAWLLF